MKKYVVAAWLSVRMVLIGVILLAAVICALPWLISGFEAYIGVLKSVDDFCGSVFFLRFERTVSGMLGEGKINRIYGYLFWANLVDVLFKKIDGPDHCVFNYFLEKHLDFCRFTVMRKRKTLVKTGGKL